MGACYAVWLCRTGLELYAKHSQPGADRTGSAHSQSGIRKLLTSRRVFRSTKTKDKKQALEICRAWHKAALKARNGLLNEDSARAIIAQGVSDVLMAANAESLPSASIKSWCETWLQAKAIETGEATRDRYKPIVEYFTGFLGARKRSATLPLCKRATLRGFVTAKRRNAHAQPPISASKCCGSVSVKRSGKDCSPSILPCA